MSDQMDARDFLCHMERAGVVLCAADLTTLVTKGSAAINEAAALSLLNRKDDLTTDGIIAVLRNVPQQRARALHEVSRRNNEAEFAAICEQVPACQAEIDAIRAAAKRRVINIGQGTAA